MFPYIEKRKRYDEYGEIIQAEQFKNKGMDGLGLVIDSENNDRMEDDSNNDVCEWIKLFVF
jgi:hypothetical protein